MVSTYGFFLSPYGNWGDTSRSTDDRPEVRINDLASPPEAQLRFVVGGGVVVVAAVVVTVVVVVAGHKWGN